MSDTSFDEDTHLEESDEPYCQLCGVYFHIGRI